MAKNRIINKRGVPSIRNSSIPEKKNKLGQREGGEGKGIEFSGVSRKWHKEFPEVN